MDSKAAAAAPIKTNYLVKDLNAPYVKVKRQGVASTVIDIVAGLWAPVLVCPFVAIVDASIINGSAGSGVPIRTGIANGFKELLFTPRTFFGKKDWRASCFLCWMVYAGTYAGVNIAKSYNESNDIAGVEADTNKFVVSLIMNLGLTQVKDGLMVKFLSAAGGKGKVKVPMLSRSLFFVRDAVTMVAAFCIADRLGDFFRDRYKLNPVLASMGANFTVPAVLQCITTVPHLYALNYSKTMNHAQTMPLVRSQYLISFFGRVCRIVPAVSVGANVNIEGRNALLKWQARMEGQTA